MIHFVNIPHFGKRLSVLLNHRLTRIYRFTSELIPTENDFFLNFLKKMNVLIAECAAMQFWSLGVI